MSQNTHLNNGSSKQAKMNPSTFWLFAGLGATCLKNFLTNKSNWTHQQVLACMIQGIH
jgi:hypothetical protein